MKSLPITTAAAFAFATSMAMAEEPRAPNDYLNCKINYTGLVVEESGLVDYDTPITFATFEISDCPTEIENYTLYIDRLMLAENILLGGKLSSMDETVIAQEIEFSGSHNSSREQAIESLTNTKDMLYPMAVLQEAFNDMAVSPCIGAEYQYIRDWQYNYDGHISIDEESLSPNQLCPTFF